MNLAQGKRKAFSQFLLSSGLYRALLPFSPSSLTIFNFHRLRENQDSPPTEFDDEVFGPTASEFRDHLKWLKANAEILSEDDLLWFLRGKRTIPSRSVMITFDDGYVDNSTIALPILKELHVPAVFFVPTQAIEERCLGWWDLITYLMKKTVRPEIALYGHVFRVSESGKNAVRVQLQERMKMRKIEENLTFIDDLAVACGVPLPSREVCSRELMSWDQVKAAAGSGIAIGSHTHSHRVLATLREDAQRGELLRSKDILEQKLGRAIFSMAYPVGGYEHFSRVTKRLARECGYQAAFSFHTGSNRVGSIDPFDVRRLSAPEAPAVYAGILSLPSIFGKRKCFARAPS